MGWFNNTKNTVTEWLHFPLSVLEKNFIDTELKNLYTNILTECYAHSNLATDKDFNSIALFDNALDHEQQKGLISLLARAMTMKHSISLVYEAGVIRLADKNDKDPIVCNFKQYELTDILKIYYSFLYLILSSINSGLNVSRAIQIKIADMRKLIARSDQKTTEDDLNLINGNLKSGKAVGLDALDKIEKIPFDIATAKESALFIERRIATSIRMPISFVTGEQSTGISATGEADDRALENGLRIYFNSIFKPIVSRLMKVNDIYLKTNILKHIQTYAQLIPIIETSEYIDDEKKAEFISGILE